MRGGDKWQRYHWSWQSANEIRLVQANATYMDDPEMAKRLMETNPNSFRKLVATFLEANGRGYWDASPEQIDRLRELYMDVEDKIEGVE